MRTDNDLRPHRWAQRRDNDFRPLGRRAGPAGEAKAMLTSSAEHHCFELSIVLLRRGYFSPAP